MRQNFSKLTRKRYVFVHEDIVIYYKLYVNVILSQALSTVRRALSDFNLGAIDQDDLRQQLIEVADEPFQADVADFFLKGPGSELEPFRSAITAANENL